jgi:hypothetical protein
VEMMEEILLKIADLIPSLGFPIICALGLAWFIYKIYTDTTKQNIDNMAAVQERCKEREEKLYQQIEKAQEVNSQAIATITLYVEKLDVIQEDVKEIKEAIIK